MNTNNQFSCYVLSENNRAIDCSKIILEKNQKLLGIISADEQTEMWANENDIPIFENIKCFLEKTKDITFDYLFSMINTNLFSEEMLAKPMKYAINFHDSLLPDYAGVNATAWAILNEEKYHGVTWHIMDKHIDAGPIVKQTKFLIHENETVLSLNLRCYEYALKLFKELVDDIMSDNLEIKCQDLNKRKLYKFSDIPESLGFINASSSIKKILSYFNAMNYGEYDNLFCSPKFLLNDEIYSFKKLMPRNADSDVRFGTIINCSETSILIRVLDGAIEIGEIYSYKMNCFIKNLQNNTSFQMGEVVEFPEDHQLDIICEYYSKYKKHENKNVKNLLKNQTNLENLFLWSEQTNHNDHYIANFEILNGKVTDLLKVTGLYDTEGICFLFNILLFIYFYKLNNYSPVGFMVSNSQRLMGPEFNLLKKFLDFSVPLVVDFDPKSTFIEVLKIFKKNQIELQSVVPFPRDIAFRYNSLSNVNFFNFIRINNALKKEQGVEEHSNIINITASQEINKVVIKIFVCKRLFLFNYNNMQNHLDNIINDIINTKGGIKIKDIDLVSGAEKQELMKYSVGSFYPTPQNCIHDIIFENAERYPNHIALEANHSKISYFQLNVLSNQFSRLLTSYRVNQGSYVAICAKRSPEFFIAVLAILKIGAAYVPLDPKYPSERLYSILESCKPALVIYNEENEAVFHKISGNKVSIEKLYNESNMEPVQELGNKIDLDNAAYVIYTSGSTGSPKGVVVRHAGLTNLCFAQRAYFKIDRNSRVLQFASISFDASVSEWAVTLAAGATLCIMSEDDVAIDLKLKEAFAKYHITVITLPPSIVSILPEELLNSLKTLIVAGERSPDSIIEKYADKLNLCNAYGPTESTVCATINHCQKCNSGSNIGRPIQNTSIYLLDKYKKLLPAGAPGEIVISGDNLAKGYLYDEELTSSKFQTLNINESDERVYLSGDIGRFSKDGSIEFMGRIDTQLKLRGYRIEPSEIEKEILKCNYVNQAIILLRINKTNHKQLIAFVVKSRSINMSERELIEEISINLKKSLPTYMLPTIICVDNIPLTINGKIDSEALLKTSFNIQHSEQKNDVEMTEIEGILSEIWCKVLKLDSVDLKADFFELGGESLLAIQIITEAKCKGININITDIFDHPTIEQLSKACNFNIQENNENETKVIDLINNNTLTPIQLWFFGQKLENVSNYSQAILLNLKINLTKKSICDMMEALLKSNTNLCSYFEQNGQFYEQKQFSLDFNKRYEIDSVEIREQDNQEDYIDQLLKKLQHELHITKGPLIRGTLILRNNFSQFFLLVIHHLLVDGVSWKIIRDHFDTMYFYRKSEKLASLNKADSNNYARWAAYLQGNYLIQALQQIDYWRAILSSSKGYLASIKAEKYLIKNTIIDYSGLNVESTRRLIRQVPKAFKTQINDILLTAMVLAFGEWSGRYCLKIMLEGHGREVLNSKIDITRTIGWFTTVYPVLLEISDPCNFSQSIKQIKEALRSIPDKGIGYGVLKYLSDTELQNEFQLYEPPHIAFNYLGQWDTSKESELFSNIELIMSNSSCDENFRANLIEINCYMHNDSLKFYWSYDKNLFPRDNIKKIIQNYHLFLDKLINFCTNDINFGYAPSDFMAKNLTQLQLDKVFGHIPNIKNIYPLSPMQVGHIFHIVSQPKSDAYHVQNLFELNGDVNEQVLKKSWELLIKKYSVFRCGYTWSGLDEPLQFELNDVDLPWESHNISNLSHEQQVKFIQNKMNDDRKIRFKYNEPPLLRLYWFYASNNKCYLLLSFHHLLLDGWCKSIIFYDLLTFYNRLMNTAQDINRDIAESYSTYINWLSENKEDQALAFWREYLKGVEQHKLPVITSNLSEPSYEYYNKIIDKMFLDHIKKYCKDNGVTLNSIFLTTWAILLCQYLNQNRIVLGVVFSGRTIALKNVDKMVGLFINSLPLKFEMLKDSTIPQHIKLVQDSINKMQQHSYVSTSKIVKMTSDPPNVGLFDVLYTFQNYPDAYSVLQASKYFKINIIEEVEKNEYPLSLNVILGPGDDVQLKFSYWTNYFNVEVISHFSNNFINALKKITEFSYPEVA